jgi:hypothetical protein
MAEGYREFTLTRVLLEAFEKTFDTQFPDFAAVIIPVLYAPEIMGAAHIAQYFLDDLPMIFLHKRYSAKRWWLTISNQA